MRRLQVVALGAKISLRVVGDTLLDVLHISVPTACKFLWWIETELTFTNISLNEKVLSTYVILKVAEAYKLLMFNVNVSVFKARILKLFCYVVIVT